MSESSNPSEKWTVCSCNTCSGKLEFDPGNAGETIQCPHCGIDTVLFIPTVRATPPPLIAEARPPEEPPPASRQPETFIATTGNEICGRSIESYVGVARGLVVRSPDIIQGVFGGLKQIVGGNIETYARVCEETRRQAFSRMIEQAKAMNADAIIAMRYDATEFAPGVTEVLAYGTAVKLAKLKA